MAKLKKTTKKKTSSGKSSVVRKTAKKKTAGKKTEVKKVAQKKTSKKKTVKKKTVEKKTVKKKTVAKKTVAKKQIVEKKARPLSAADIEHFKKLLLHKRAELIGDVNSIESDALRTSRMDASGDLSSMPIHMADIGTDNFEQEFALGLMSSERKILVEINAALKRIEQRKYGICEGTHKPISKVRLEANPWARYCIEYARMVEQGMIVEGQKVYGDDDPYGIAEMEEELELLEELEERDSYAFSDDDS